MSGVETAGRGKVWRPFRAPAIGKGNKLRPKGIYRASGTGNSADPLAQLMARRGVDLKPHPYARQPAPSGYVFGLDTFEPSTAERAEAILGQAEYYQFRRQVRASHYRCVACKQPTNTEEGSP